MAPRTSLDSRWSVDVITNGHSRRGGTDPMRSALGGNAMTVVVSDRPFVWWKEPSKDQWLAWFAGFLGWMLDAFDFTIFFLIMVPISQEFGVPLTLVAGTVTFTLWLRLLGAFGLAV